MSAIVRAELSLALIAARGRLTKAEKSLNEFWLEHNGTAPSRELQAAWERQRHLLETECDEAARFLKKCEADLREAA